MEKNPIIIPLDGMTRDRAFFTAKRLDGKVWGLKANDLLDDDNGGRTIIKELKAYGNVFADAKFHDIPATVGNRVAKFAQAEPDLITVHASGGVEMMAEAVKNQGNSKILAVTVLTSLNEDDTNHIYGSPVKTKVLEMARDAVLAGVYGIVCSAKELEFLSQYDELRELVKVTPGIRPKWFQDASDDQKRTMAAAEAVKLGADYLVIGRPILRAKDPVEAVERTLEEIARLT